MVCHYTRKAATKCPPVRPDDIMGALRGGARRLRGVTQSSAVRVTRLPSSFCVVKVWGRGKLGQNGWHQRPLATLLLGCQPVRGRREASTWPQPATPLLPRVGTGTTSNSGANQLCSSYLQHYITMPYKHNILLMVFPILPHNHYHRICIIISQHVSL